MPKAEAAASSAPASYNFAVDVVDRWARERPDATALWHVDAHSGGQKQLSFKDLSRVSRQYAAVFHRQGIRPGDRVLLMLPRLPQWWIILLALTRLRAVPVPATLLLTERDVAFRLECARVSAVVTNPDGLPKVTQFEGKRFLVEGGAAGWVDLDYAAERAEAACPEEPTPAGDPGILYFTSATTGDPKMVLHTQVSYALGHHQTGKLWLDLQPNDVHWNISDLGWGKAAWSSFYGPWQMGACVFALDFRGKFDAIQALDTLATYPITTWCAPPTALRLIVRQDLSKWRLPHLRHCVTAGEPLNPEVYQIWKSATGLELHEAYGQTETVVLIGNFRCLGRPIRPGSMGLANPNFDLSLVDEHLGEVPAGQEGEVAIRVRPHRPLGLFKEYWLNPMENSQKFRGDWYLTGDRATRDADGYFWFIGRKDDVIKSSGYRIGPFEVESALLEHPGVLDVAVIGKADALRGQIVKAYVVLRSGFEASEETRTALQQHCKRLVAAYKYPREVEFVSELPKTTSGKTRHVALRQREMAAAPTAGA